MSAKARVTMQLGVELVSEICDAKGSPSGDIVTDGKVRISALNLGVISLYVTFHTQIVGSAVVEKERQGSSWEDALLLPPSARPKAHASTERRMTVLTSGEPVAFHTRGSMATLVASHEPHWSRDHYECPPLAVFGTTK